MAIIDLTLPIDEDTPVLPGDPPFAAIEVATVAADGFRQRRLSFGSHFATHVDAPSHMLEHGETLSDVPLEHCIGEAVTLDVRGQPQVDIQLTDVRAGDIVLFYTGHTDRLRSADYFMTNPVLTPALAERLVAAHVKAVGIDSFTVDHTPYAVHKLLLSHGIVIVENLVNLKNLAGQRCRCYILPLKLTGADGAPCRVIGILP